MRWPSIVALALLILTMRAHADMNLAELYTHAERTDYQETGRYDEVQVLCRAYASRWPDARCIQFGVSPERRPLLVLVVTRAGSFDPAELRRRNVPVLCLQGGIHPGESDGKDAGFQVLRELLAASPSTEDPLKHMAILFVPVFNADGHERFGSWNRPNQVGPKEMGWRTTAQNLNLNRDYMKADAPEMRSMLGLLTDWDPIVYADLHVTDGANFEHDVSVQVEPIHEGAASLFEAGRALRDAVLENLTRNGSLPLPFYPSLVVEDDPASGFAESAYLPRFSTGYWALRNRFSVLVETHSWKNYATRVRVTANTIRALVQLVSTQGRGWRELAAQADRDASRLGGAALALNHEAGLQVSMIDFRGYAYTRSPSPISGRLVTRYDPSQPAIWHVPYRNSIVPSLTVTLPRAGYWVPAGYAAELVPRLSAHGVAFKTLDVSRVESVSVFRAAKVLFSPSPNEGRTPIDHLEGGWHSEEREIPAGSLWVPIAQPKARLVAALMEPQAPDSFASWGFFNSVFERKEYVEPYVAEEFAAQMLQRDPALAREFNDRLANDETFASDGRARLDFFYQRHPSWDERWNLVPVYRSDAPS